MQRRQFVQKSLGTAAFLALTGCARPDESEPQPTTPVHIVPKAGLQLYTVRTLLEKDFEGTIEKVAALGYEEVEFHAFFGRTAEQVRSVLDDAGLRAPARHVGLPNLRTGIDKVLDESAALGCDWIVCSYIDASERTLDGYRRAADDLNIAGAVCREAGRSFAYHNHDFEFAPIGDVVPYDLLLERCDNDLVAMELDLFWITKGGANPMEYFNQYPGRFTLCHVKDMAVDGSMAEVGSGIIDFGSIFAAADQAGLAHYFVEHDEPADPMASITASYSGLIPLLKAI